jgi:ketosteroid isomerase-like protein
VDSRSGDVLAFVDDWAHAEQRGDATRLCHLLDDDFVAVTGDGATLDTLDKRTWIDRYRSGRLVHHAFCWRSIATRVTAGHVFVVGTIDHASSYAGHRASGRHTVSLTVTARDGRLQLTSLHAS